MNEIKILHVEDEAMFSEGIATNLGERFAVSLARNDEQIAACLAHTKFDLILLDIYLDERRNALDLMALLHATGIPVLVLSNHATNADMRALARLGAQGFVSKQLQMGDLLKAIDMVLAENTAFSKDFMRIITAKTTSELPYMTGQQTVVLSHLVGDPGKRTAGIASEMGVSVPWVQSLIGQLFNQFRVQSRADLVEEARKRGFVPQRVQFAAA